MQFSAAVRTSR